MIKLPEELSSTDFPTEPSAAKKKSRQLSQPTSPDHMTQREYLQKLRGQRTKIEQLYKDYDKALNRISRQECELLAQRSITRDSTDTIGVLSEQQQELDRGMLAIRENEQLRRDKQTLAEELAAVKLKLEKLQSTRSEGIEQVKEFFLQEIRSLELDNGDLKQRSDEVQERYRRIELELDEKNQAIERLEHEKDALKLSAERMLKDERARYSKLQEILHEREQQLQRASELTRKLQEEASELNYFMELEKEKSEELQLHYSSSLLHLKKQNSQLERQLSRMREDFDRSCQDQIAIRDRLNESQTNNTRIAEELRQQKEKFAAIDELHVIERNQLQRKLAASRLEWQQQLEAVERSRSLLQHKYDKLKQRCQALLGRESAKRQLQLHSYEEIDRLQELLRM